MQPRTVGPKTERLIELEATVPQCVYNMIKAIPGMSVLSFTQHTDLVALPLRPKNGAAAAHFDKRVSSNAFPQGLEQALAD